MKRRAIVALSTVVLLSVMLGGTALAASVDPVEVPGNPVCSGTGGLGFDYGIKIDPPVEGTFALGAGTVTISDIDTSVNPATFSWSSSGVTVLAVVAKGGPGANVYYYNPPASTGDSGLHAPNGFSHINFCYDDSQMPGTLKVKKVVEGGPEGFQGTFPVTVDCGDGGTFTGDISYPNTGYRTFIDLPAGAECEVTEGTLPAAPDGYTWGTPSYSGNPATIKEDGKSYVTVTNTLIAPGSLRITKAISGGPGEIGGSFDVTVDCGDAGTFHRTITVPDPGEVTIDGIEADAECTVDEDIIQEDPALGFFWGPPSFVGNPATIVSGQTVTIDVTNNLERKPPADGSLKIIKDIPGVPEGFVGSFGVRVTCTEIEPIDATIEFPDPGFVTIDDLPAGVTCAVIETSRSDPPEGFEWAGALFAGTATIVANQTAEVTVTNLLTEQQGVPVLTIVKSNDATNPTFEGLTVTYKLDYSVSEDEPVSGAVIKDVLPEGVTYQVGSATNSAGNAFVFAGYDDTTRTLTWTAAADITVNGSVGYKVTLDDGSAEEEQPLTNTACIDSDETEEFCDESDVFVVVPPQVETHVVTGPPTDVIERGDSTTSGGSMLLVLLMLAGVVGAILTFAPVPASFRKRNR